MNERRYIVAATILAMGAGVFMCVYAIRLAKPYLVEAYDLPTFVSINICGDGFVNGGEVCDDGTANNFGGYGSSTAERKCNSDCGSFGPYCGDGVLHARYEEACDDGNNTSGDLCNVICKEEAPSPPGGNGAPSRGSIPAMNGGGQGSIRSEIATVVVLRGKAYPNSLVKILLDGKSLTTVKADANADFQYTTSDVTPGTATFSFLATDPSGTTSMTTSVIFDVLQSAITTVANIFIPPTVVLSAKQIEPGGLLTINGYSVPKAKTLTQIAPTEKGAVPMSADVDTSGKWALQIDTKSLTEGYHAIKSYFQLTDTIKSGFGRSINFYVGAEAPTGDDRSPDLNGDGKVNLVDFSIFLTSWNTDAPRPDFNQDSTVNLADFSIMLFHWTG